MANIIARIIVMGGQILGRSFVRAWQEASKNAAKEGPAVSRAVRSKAGNITLGEAKQILHLQDAEKITLEDVIKRHDHLFAVNAQEKGGSQYLQSKVVCARIRLEEALKNKELS